MAVSMKKSQNKPAWAKSGNAAKKAVEKEDQKQQQKMDQMNRMRRFWIPPEKETQITFLDGNLDDDGVLDTMVFYEHQVFMNGNWRNWFICTADDEPCPICEGGDEPYLAGVFTIIDHSEFTTNQGKTFKNQPRLFVAKRQTLKLLQKKAAKNGGLAGCTFDVSRTGGKSPGVGDVFDLDGKRSLSELKLAFPDVESWEPAAYDEEIVYHSAKELRSMGFGVSGTIGAEPAMADNAETESVDTGL